MLENINIEKILFLDIETVSQAKNFDELPSELKLFWERKSDTIEKEGETAFDTYNRAGIYSEFGKIICISVGYIKFEGGIKNLRIKSFYGGDEKVLLAEFFDLLNHHFNSPQHLLCAHNGKEFDFPYIGRRGLINGLKIPTILDIAGKKPWEVNHLDTMQLWKFGDYKNYTSLSLLTTIFNIPTPKDDIDGSMVNEVYWTDNDLERIVTYCQKDVVALTQLFLKFKNEPLINDNDIIIS